MSSVWKSIDVVGCVLSISKKCMLSSSFLLAIPWLQISPGWFRAWRVWGMKFCSCRCVYLRKYVIRCSFLLAIPWLQTSPGWFRAWRDWAWNSLVVDVCIWGNICYALHSYWPFLDYRSVWSFCMCIHSCGPQFIVSSKGLFHRVHSLTLEKSWGAQQSLARK